MKKSRIAVIGGGSWATALVKILQENHRDIAWYIREEYIINHIKQHQHNPEYLSMVQLKLDKLFLTNNINDAVENSQIVLVVTPSAFIKSALEGLSIPLDKKIVVSAIKGMIPDENLIMADFFHQKYQVPYESFCVIAGPSHAEEVAMERLSYLTVACPDVKKAAKFASAIENSFIKVTTSDDIWGTEYSAVLKNVFAVASGICAGLGYGDNFQAVLVSNAVQEIERFVKAVHPIERDIKSSAYLGDLLVTAYSQFSRNRSFGMMVGKGYSVKNAQLEMRMVAEGYYAVKCIKQVNEKYKVHMPITDAVYNILYEKISPSLEIKLLTEMLR